MANIATDTNLAQTFWPVKFPGSDIGSYSPHSMIHHKVTVSKKCNLLVHYTLEREKRYGVSSIQRALPRGVFIKEYDRIRDSLRVLLGLAPAQREAVLRLLRFWCYYRAVYVKAAQVAEQPGCSRATFWRTIAILKRLGLLEVRNRYVLRPHAQISNLYLLDKLVIMIAKYLAEHGGHIWPDWLDQLILLPWPKFWRALERGQLILPLRVSGSHTAL